MDDMIYRIEPQNSPLFKIWAFGRFEFIKQRGGKMRKQRRRKAKPVRFTAASKTTIGRHEWIRDVLVPWHSA